MSVMLLQKMELSLGRKGEGRRKKQTWSSPVPSLVQCGAGPAGRRRNGSVPSSGT